MKNEITTTENVNDKVLIEYLDVMGISPKLKKKEKACNPKLIQIIEIERINPANNLAEKASFLLLQNKIFPTSKPKIPIANTNKKYPSPS